MMWLYAWNQMYIYNIIEENMNENMYLGTNLNLNYLNKLLLFIEELLDYFHQILDKKIIVIKYFSYYLI